MHTNLKIIVCTLRLQINGSYAKLSSNALETGKFSKKTGFHKHLQNVKTEADGIWSRVILLLPPYTHWWYPLDLTLRLIALAGRHQQMGQAGM